MLTAQGTHHHRMRNGFTCELPGRAELCGYHSTPNLRHGSRVFPFLMHFCCCAASSPARGTEPWEAGRERRVWSSCMHTGKARWKVNGTGRQPGPRKLRRCQNKLKGALALAQAQRAVWPPSSLQGCGWVLTSKGKNSFTTV